MKFTAIALLVAFVGATPPPDTKEELAKAAEKTRELENYRFKGGFAVDGVPFLAEPVEFNGAFVKDKGFMASMGPVGTIFRLEKKVAVKDPETGEWVLIKQGTKVGEGPLSTHIPMLARGLKPPHDDLKSFEERFKEIQKRDAKEKVGDAECQVYEGPLTEKGIRAMLPAGASLLIGKGTFEGTARVWVGPEGRFVKFEADCKIQVEQDGTTTDLAIKRHVQFVDVGKATVEMPAEVKKLFDE